jgi:NAD(P)-dependent dehydrogenase (short-subunit alcohol dehydrogenase family)
MRRTPSRAGGNHTLGTHRVALVSGGNRGLGLELVSRLAALDMRVVLGCRSVEQGRVAIERLGDLADLVAVRQLDIGDAASVAGLMAWLDRRVGRCDVLVNNASVLLDDDRDAASVELERVRRTLETNLLGMWRLVQSIAPLMRRDHYGRIVNISCGLATMPRGASAYRVSKSAVNALTRVLADELAADGILVNACCPVVDVSPPDSLGLAALSLSAETPVWLATLPDDGPTGAFWRSRSPIDR